MSQRRLAAVLLAAGLLFAVVGCSSGGTSTALNQQPDKAPAVGAPSTAGGADAADEPPTSSKSDSGDDDSGDSDSDSGDSTSGGGLHQWCVAFSKAMGDSLYAGRGPGAPTRDSVKAELQTALKTAPAELPAEIKNDVATLVDAHLAMAAGDVNSATQKMNSPERKAATDRYMAWHTANHC
jgi:hypothetical protein